MGSPNSRLAGAEARFSADILSCFHHGKQVCVARKQNQHLNKSFFFLLHSFNYCHLNFTQIKNNEFVFHISWVENPSVSYATVACLSFANHLSVFAACLDTLKRCWFPSPSRPVRSSCKWFCQDHFLNSFCVAPSTDGSAPCWLILALVSKALYKPGNRN